MLDRLVFPDRHARQLIYNGLLDQHVPLRRVNFGSDLKYEFR